MILPKANHKSPLKKSSDQFNRSRLRQNRFVVTVTVMRLTCLLQYLKWLNQLKTNHFLKRRQKSVQKIFNKITK